MTTVVNVMAPDAVGTAAAQAVSDIRVLGPKTNAATATYAMAMANVLFVFKKPLDGRRFMRDMKKTIASIVERVATADSAWETDVGPVGRVEFARPAEDQVTANFDEAAYTSSIIFMHIVLHQKQRKSKEKHVSSQDKDSNLNCS